MAKTVFTDGDKTLKLPGTRLLASWLNKVFNHRHDGADADGSAPINYGVDTGAVNACEITLTPPLTAHIPGMPITMKVAVTNTGAATLKINALAPVAIVKGAADPLDADDLQAGQLVTVAYDGAAYQLITYRAPASSRIPVGKYGEFASPTEEPGWLYCDGREVSRAQYAALFAKIGTTYGSGDNLNTFNLPDARGCVLRGWGDDSGIDPGRVFGSVQEGSIEEHAHPFEWLEVSPSAVEDGDANPLQFKVDTGTAGSAVQATGHAVTGPEGGTETRMRNLASFICIKY